MSDINQGGPGLDVCIAVWECWRAVPRSDKGLLHMRDLLTYGEACYAKGAASVAAPQAAPRALSDDEIIAGLLPLLGDERAQAARAVLRDMRGTTAAAGAPATVPAGWALVPAEPTIGMCIAGDEARMNADDATRTPAVYRAMLAAAPGAPATVQPLTELLVADLWSEAYNDASGRRQSLVFAHAVMRACAAAWGLTLAEPAGKEGGAA